MVRGFFLLAPRAPRAGRKSVFHAVLCLTRRAVGGMLSADMNLKRLLLAATLFGLCTAAQAVQVIMTGGVALRSWENNRGPLAHDNWWANFVRASTVQMEITRSKDPQAQIVWLVYRPAYVTRGVENKTDYISRIRETAAKYKVKLVFFDTMDQMYKALNSAPRGRDRITHFYYFGHSNPNAFMLDYSNYIVAASTVWMHEDDLAKRIKPGIFAPDAECWSYGCFTGCSMSKKWKQATGAAMWGNLESTRYQPVGDGKLPQGVGKWVQ